MSNLDLWDHQASDDFSTYPFLVEESPICGKFLDWIRLADIYYKDFPGRIPVEDNAQDFYSNLNDVDKKSFEKYYYRAILQLKEISRFNRNYQTLLEIGPGLGFLGIPTSNIDYCCYEKIEIVKHIRQYFYEAIQQKYHEIDDLNVSNLKFDVVFASNVLSELSQAELVPLLKNISELLKKSNGILIIHDWLNPKNEKLLLEYLGMYFGLVEFRELSWHPGHYSIVLDNHKTYLSALRLKIIFMKKTMSLALIKNYLVKQAVILKNKIK